MLVFVRVNGGFGLGVDEFFGGFGVGFGFDFVGGDGRIEIFDGGGGCGGVPGRGMLFARIQGDRDKIREHGEASGEGRGGGLGAKQGRERVTGTAGGAGGDEIGAGVLELVRGTLQRRQIVAESARNGLFEGLFE